MSVQSNVNARTHTFRTILYRNIGYTCFCMFFSILLYPKTIILNQKHIFLVYTCYHIMHTGLLPPKICFSNYHLCCFLTTPHLIYFHLPRELACLPSPIHFLTKHVDMIAEALSFISGKTCLSLQASRYIHSGTEDNVQRIPRTFAKPH